MNFEKRPTTVDEQIELLVSRGMTIGERSLAHRCLETIGYYRLSAYWLPFERVPMSGATRSKTFETGTSFAKVHELYVFDRRLRALLLEAIERIEIHVRSRWTFYMAHAHGAHAYLDYSLFSGSLKHAEQLVRLARAVDKSEETFIVHYKQKYSLPEAPPLWAATELMTFGEISKWYQATKDNKVKSAVARDIGLPTIEVCEGVLQNFSYVRNICAHHNRLWNRRLVKRLPKIKRFHFDLENEVMDGSTQPVNLVYNTIVVMLLMLHQQNTDSTFRARLQDLIETATVAEREAMGFPSNWRWRPAWNL